MKSSIRILTLIVVSQFCCTSLWFAGNGVMEDLIQHFDLEQQALGHLTASVQFGFIAGTLLFALLAVSDRFSPSKVFFASALLAAIFNFGMVWDGHQLWSLMGLRFMVGFFLAGIYPVGMKIAADYYDKGLGKSLGFLVGALVVGTAFPHLLKSIVEGLPWKYILNATAMLSVVGGGLMLVLVPDGPFRKPAQSLDLAVLFKAFGEKRFRGAAFGYFGHMWELYAFWAFVPFMLKTYHDLHAPDGWDIPLLSFFIIAVGGLGCVMAGYLSQRLGVKRTAIVALSLSGLCCLMSPFAFDISNAGFFIGFLLFWGVMVVADSPLFSTMVAQNAAPEIKGSALTIVNCVGFSITIVSIQLLNLMRSIISPVHIYLILAFGAFFGLFALRNIVKSKD